MRGLPLKVVRGLCLLAVLVGGGRHTVRADLITILSNPTEFRRSTTVVAVGPNDPATWSGVTSLPGPETFSIIPTPGSSQVHTVTGATNLFSGPGISFYRSTFTLPPFNSITLDLLASFDDSMEIFINGQLLAREASLDPSNYNDTVDHRVFVANNGVVTNGNFLGGQGFDRIAQPFPTSRFNVGPNELILAVRNLAEPDTGGFSFRADFTTISAVPEPTSMILLGSGLLCLVGYGVRRETRRAGGDRGGASEENVRTR